MDELAYRQFLELERGHWWFRGRRHVYLGLLEHELRGERPARALDLGAGMGGFLDGLGRLCERVVHTDISLESLSNCRRRGHTRGALASGYALPFQDESFELVCMFDAIEHIPDDAAVMREALRVLKPGGRVLISVPAYPLLYANNDRVAQHERRYTRASLRALFASAGFELERNSHANVFLVPLILPAVLGVKLVERALRLKADPRHTNLSWPMPAPVHGLLYRAFAAELPFTRRFDWPAGHSLVALARKPGAAAVRSGRSS
jgi:SAM-dependent methyltransferase